MSSVVADAALTTDVQTRKRLFARFYDELHYVAQRTVRRNAAAALSATTLLHETFLSIVHRESLEFRDSRHFVSYVARAMRGLIVDNLRSRKALKRGGEFAIASLLAEQGAAAPAVLSPIVERLDEALEALTRVDPHLAQCVDLRFFYGLSAREIADLQAVSERTVQRDWDKARLLLSRFMQGQQDQPPPCCSADAAPAAAMTD